MKGNGWKGGLKAVKRKLDGEGRDTEEKDDDVDEEHRFG